MEIVVLEFVYVKLYRIPKSGGPYWPKEYFRAKRFFPFVLKVFMKRNIVQHFLDCIGKMS